MGLGKYGIMCKKGDKIMKINLYESFGALAHEKEPVYSQFAPASDVYNRITVELPHVTGETIVGEPVLTLDGEDYPLRYVLATWGGKPALRWHDGQHPRRMMLEVVESK